MTNEEKAKAYDDALKIAQCWLNSPQTIEDCGYTVEDAIQSIFPALKESDDERIRKELIEFIKWSVDRHFMREDFHQAKRPSEWISYLEKQKEQKPVEKHDLVAQLKEHLANTPKEQLEAEWKELEKWNHVGPTVEEYLRNIKLVEWNKNDEAFLKVAIAVCNRYSHKDIADWLKFLPERFNLKSKH